MVTTLAELVTPSASGSSSLTDSAGTVESDADYCVRLVQLVSYLIRLQARVHPGHVVIDDVHALLTQATARGQVRLDDAQGIVGEHALTSNNATPADPDR